MRDTALPLLHFTQPRNPPNRSVPELSALPIAGYGEFSGPAIVERRVQPSD